MALIVSLVFVQSLSSTPLPLVWAQSTGPGQLPSSSITENFSFEYTYVDSICAVECESYRILYNSSTNEFAVSDLRPNVDLVIRKVLNDEEEALLRDSIDALRLRGDEFNAAGD